MNLIINYSIIGDVESLIVAHNFENSLTSLKEKQKFISPLNFFRIVDFILPKFLEFLFSQNSYYLNAYKFRRMKL